MIPGKRYTPEDVIDAAWRHKWWILVPSVLVTVAAFVLVMQLPARYRSQTMIEVVPRSVPDALVKSTVQARLEDRIQSLGQQIITRERLERIITDLSLYPQLRKQAAMEYVVDELRRDIGFNVVDRTAFRLSYAADDPKTALAVTERLAVLFIEENARDREGQAAATEAFFDSQLEDARTRLAESESKVERYRRQFAGELPDQVPSNLQAQNSARLELQALTDSLNRDREQRLYLQRQIDMQNAAPIVEVSGSAAARSPETGTTADQLEAARAKLRAMEGRVTPEHPEYGATKRRIAKLEEKLAAERPAGAAPATRTMSAGEAQRALRVADLQAQIELVDRQIATRQADEVRLRATIATYRNRIEVAPRHELELTALTRDYDTIKRLYDSLLTKKEDVRLAANLEAREIGERFRTIEPPRLPVMPYSPNRLRLMLLAGAVGLVIGLSLAAVREYRDTSVRTDDEVVRSLGIPVLAVIPELAAGDRGAWRSRASSLALLLVPAVSSLLALAGAWA